MKYELTIFFSPALNSNSQQSAKIKILGFPARFYSKNIAYRSYHAVSKWK